MRPLGYALATLAVATLIVIPTRPPEAVTVPAGPEPTVWVTTTVTSTSTPTVTVTPTVWVTR